MKSAPVIEKFKRGPVGLLTVLPSGPPAMGKNMVEWFLYCGDQHLCRLSVRPFAGTRDCFLASIPRRRHDCFLRIRRSSRSGIDLERSKLGGHAQASFRQPDLRVADGGNIRLAMAEIALVASRLSFKLSKSGRYTY